MKHALIAFLKQVNAMPFRFSMKHYQVFGSATEALKDQELNSAQSWDALRETHPFFSISENRDEWLAASELAVAKDGQDTALAARADEVVALIQRKGFDRVFSTGVGGAALEYQIKKKMPQLPVVCSDYSAETVRRLQKVFTESDGVIEFDILKGDWKAVERQYLGTNGLCIMYRLDAGFSDDQWHIIFDVMQEAGVTNVLVIPTGTLTMLSIYNRKKRELLWALKHIPVVFSGYLRTKHRFISHWDEWYDTEEATFGGLKGFLLKKRAR
ncbi:MAG TPA: hypothetical protein PK109_00215 [Candidatus Paceibacterota bacterium]|nr:hypothetical protein [Candidatus Paceibacterota bacterium]